MASELLPTDRQLPTLLRKITLAGQQTGVTFTLFRPGGMKPSDYHTEMPISVAVSGDYHSVGSFLAELANMRRIVTVSNLKLTSNNKNDNAAPSAASGQLIEVVDVVPAENAPTHDQRWVAECKKVAADGTLAGILTDGDLRRLMEKHGGAVVDMKLADCMTRNPQTIGPDVLASEALTLMEKRRITCVIVIDEQRRVLGVVHLHDLWGLQLV